MATATTMAIGENGGGSATLEDPIKNEGGGSATPEDPIKKAV